MYTVYFTEPAKNDLSSISQYICGALKAPGAAKDLLSKIEKRLQSIREFPFSCPLVNDEYLAIKEIRSLIVNNYQIFYIVKKKEKNISVIRILYARRDWVYLLQ